MAATSRFGMHCRAAACALILAAATISVANAAEPIRFDIASQPLVPALKAFAAQSKMQLLYEQDAVRHATGNAVVGNYEKRDALQILLQGTGLEIVFSADNAATIRTKSDSAAVEENRVKNIRLAQADAMQGTDSAIEKTAQESARHPEQTIDEIVVTAQKRAERLQDVPISISVLGGAFLDRSTDQGVNDALNAVPGVMAQDSYIGGGTQVSIRGVAAGSTILHGSSPIAYYLDSVPFGLIKSAVGPDASAYDLERVEVLRGPQGTLYGASALNGVVRVLTRDADLNGFDFKGRASGSSTDGGGGNYRGDMAINVPLIEGKLAMRAVVGYADENGWIDRPSRKDANDAELRNYRLKLNARPTDALSIGLSAWRSRSQFGAPSMAADDGRYSIPAEEPMSTDYDAYGLKIGYDMGGVSVAAMTSYLDYENSGALSVAALGLPNVPFVNAYFAHVFSQEINVVAELSESWRWTVGGIYRDEKDRTFQTIEGILPAPTDFDDASQSYAVFSELTRRFLGGRLELTGGLRYFSDTVETAENTTFTAVPGTPLIKAESKFHKTSPRVVLNWHPTDQMTVYTSYAEGFRSGFQQQPNVVALTRPVEADSLKNYEIGAKGNMLDGRLAFDTAVYYIDWRDVQSDNAIVLNQVPIASLVNGGSASGVGFDLSIITRPIDNLELTASYSTNDLSWDQDVFAGSSLLLAAGERLSLSPKYTAAVSASYTAELGGGSGYELGFTLAGNYTAEQFIKITTGFGQAEPIFLGRASVSLSSPDRWTATLFVGNFTNEDRIVQQAPFPVADWAVRARPRTIGLQFEYRR